MSEHPRRGIPALLKRWALPAATVVVALVAALILFAKLRRDVWTYYTDGEGVHTEVTDKKARPVLWQDPEPQHFEGKAGDAADTLEAAFSADGTTMVLVRRGESADLYLSRWDGRSWSPPQPIESVNTKANERSPELSSDGRFLYFASDREGGLGGLDLYLATWDGKKWTGVQALPPTVNSAANETGPALAADGTQLYFSSDRDGGGEDIFVAAITTTKKPDFAASEPVSDLNSKAADVEAAMTSRGDHVFLASDRDRDAKAGFKVYISRVIDGKPLPPELVDLYIKEGDATDPAVRMDGFDLLFSTGGPETADGDDSAHQLFRSTTREVVGYTDISRWEDFKALMHHIAWWIVLAVAALIALIYILEKWRDMTSLFHKCLAGSAVVHLALLLLTMLWLIANQIEDAEKSKQEVSINIDALAEEELALEIEPEEALLTETSTNLETEKVEAEFGAPGFEEQKDAQPMPEAAQTVKESELVEAQPAMSEPLAQPLPEPAEQASMLSELAAAALPEVDTPLLEEATPREAEPVADPREDTFEPEPLMTETPKTEVAEVADAAVESQPEMAAVTEAQTQPPLAEAPKESVVEAFPRETPGEAPAAPQPLESAMLSELAPPEFQDPAAVALDEGHPENAEAPADSSKDEFSPDNAMVSLSNTPAPGEPVADSAMTSAADAASVATGETGSNPSAIDPVAANTGSDSAADQSLPASALDAGSPGGLPELTLTDPGTPMLEEPADAPADAPANPSNDVFIPDQSAPSLTTAPAPSESVADTALATQPDSTAVTGAEMVAGAPTIEARPPELTSAAPAESLPPTAAAPAKPGSLPEVALLDPGAPLLEEPAPQAPGAPANPAAEIFKPGGPATTLVTSQAKTSAVADAAVNAASDPAAVDHGGMVTSSALSEVRPTAPAAGPPVEKIAPTSIEGGLPALALVEDGAPPLEEGGKMAARPPTDPGKDQFKPGNVASNLATAPAAGRAVSDQAVADPGAAAAAAVSETRSDLTGGAPMMPVKLEAAGPRPDLPTNGPAPDLAAATPMDALLPGQLDEEHSIDPKGMALVVQKQRGKPGIDTIKELGGSDGTEKAIKAAFQWLVKNQEDDGHWDTRKHGAQQNYDNGGTGLALLCFYGWGERHDQACDYQDNARRALDWMLKQQDKDGYLGERPGMMYSHAISTIALCEAYGLTHDQRLKEPAQRAIAYTLAAQSKTHGGWRYSPGNDSDTSVTGWQFMALHSARMAGLEVPEEAFDRARSFLDKMGGGQHGGLYGYQERRDVSVAMVATGMFCRQLDLVPPSSPKMQESARIMKLHPIKADNPDLYYIYYATLALYQHQGPIWHDWNERLKEVLPQLQKDDGSWNPSSSMAGEGGRVISTTLSTLSLEVYYRLLPMYGFRNEEADAPQQKQRGE